MQALFFAVNGGDSGGAVRGYPALLAGEERDDLSQRGQLIRMFREVRTPLYCYLVSIGIQPDQADDVIQESFVRLHEQLEIGTKIENPRGWLFRVAHNLSISLHRVERRLVSDSADVSAGSESAAPRLRIDPQPNPEELYLKAERMKRLETGLSHLTQQQRECLYLRAEGLRYREIAAVLGIGVSAVGEHIQRAIARLAGELHA
jgi:RNA polymerase sigma-70 factor (ECF subfamily)